MTWEAIVAEAIQYFEDNEDDFIDAIEELDSYNGYLGDDRVEDMEFLNEIYSSTEPLEVLRRAFYGYDATYGVDDDNRQSFNPNRDYFYFNGYGNLVSTDYKDYSDKLDEYFIEELYNNSGNLNLPDEIVELFDSRDAE